MIERLITLAFLACSAPAFAAQGYPDKPIRVLAPEAGGGVDFVARIIAREMSLSMGQS
jgi:tripartite-type tricarboxylate transporter receptor subunit TctC